MFLCEEGVERCGVALHELLVAAHGVIADVRLDVGGDVKEITKTLKCPAEKIRPLRTFKFRLTAAGEVDHPADVRVIPAAKRHPRNQVLFIHETKGLRI